MVPVASIYVGGGLTLLLTILHFRFYSMFGWADALSRGSRNSMLGFSPPSMSTSLVISHGTVSTVEPILHRILQPAAITEA